MFAPSRINTIAALINHEAFISLCISGLQPETHPREICCAVLREIGLAVLLFERTGAEHWVCMLNASTLSSREVS